MEIYAVIHNTQAIKGMQISNHRVVIIPKPCNSSSALWIISSWLSIILLGFNFCVLMFVLFCLFFIQARSDNSTMVFFEYLAHNCRTYEVKWGNVWSFSVYFLPCSGSCETSSKPSGGKSAVHILSSLPVHPFCPLCIPSIVSGLIHHHVASLVVL